MSSSALTDFLQRGTLVIHLGAHKTATTYIQSALKAQRDRLKAEGVSMVLPSDLRRSGVLRRTRLQTEARRVDGAGTAVVPDLSAFLAALAADERTRRITISEEGFIGSPRNNLIRRSLYPDLLAKLENLPDLFDHPNVTFLFALRDYGNFFSSSVTTALRRGKIFDLAQLRLSLMMLHRSWVDVVADFRVAFPRARLKIWRYDQFQALEPRVFAELAPGVVAPASARVFETLSARAVQSVLDQAVPAKDLEKRRRIVWTAIRQFPISDENPPFTLWSEDEAAHLTFRYDLDWRAICERHPGIALARD